MKKSPKVVQVATVVASLLLVAGYVGYRTWASSNRAIAYEEGADQSKALPMVMPSTKRAEVLPNTEQWTPIPQNDHERALMHSSKVGPIKWQTKKFPEPEAKAEQDRPATPNEPVTPR